MHRGVHRWKRVAKTNMLSDRLIIYFVYKIGTPIPLQTRGIERVEHTLQRRLRQRTYKIEGGLLESTNGLKCFFGFGEWTSICPDDSTHFLHVKMLGKRRRWRDSEKSKASGELQSAKAGCVNNSARSSKAEHVRSMIDIAPRASPAGCYCLRGRINPRVFHRREINNETVIADSQASRVMSATANGEKQVLFSGKLYRADYIRHISAACYQARLFVDHSIVHFAGIVVTFIARLDC